MNCFMMPSDVIEMTTSYFFPVDRQCAIFFVEEAEGILRSQMNYLLAAFKGDVKNISI